jgi:hypothetical protein
LKIWAVDLVEPELLTVVKAMEVVAQVAATD